MSLPSQSARVQEAGSLGFRARLAVALAAGILLGAGVAAVSPGPFWNGWLAAAALLAPALLALLFAWRWGSEVGGLGASDCAVEPGNHNIGRMLAWLVALAFILRLGGGIGLSLALPVWGYAEDEQQAGYLFKDAYYRDTQAWNLALSAEPLWTSFREEFSTDQYGGLLALSALVYRYLSPDAHRPYLILILGAFFAALGVPFLWRAARLHWNERVAALAAWIYVLYPDAIFFSSSQMREPFLVGLSAVAFWAVLAWSFRNKSTWLALIASLLGMALISSRVAAAMAGVLGLLFLLEHVIIRPNRRWRVLGWAALAGGLILVLAFSWDWFRSSAGWDMLRTTLDAGRVKLAIKELQTLTGLRLDEIGYGFLAIYGLTRPLLPAAIAQNAASSFWKAVGIIRSAGWYGLAPFLVYGFFWVWKVRDFRPRRLGIWLLLVVSLWLLIASARGGADVTDNPRYRSQFIIWIALLAAWSIDWALTHRDPWLWRWIGIEVIFLGFFTHWYLSRYYRLWLKLPLWQMIALIAVLSGLVLAGGWAWDRWRARRLAKKSQLPEGVE